jgi:hypothetical protein
VQLYFQNPDVTFTGDIDLSEKNVINITPDAPNVEAKGSNAEVNKGAFYQKFHYDLTSKQAIDPKPMK